jgi:hypothetical protein
MTTVITTSLRASVAANKITRSASASTDSPKLGAASSGDVLDIVRLQRTPSGTTRAQTSDGWVTATTREGKRLLHTDVDLQTLLEARQPEPEAEREAEPELSDEGPATGADKLQAGPAGPERAAITDQLRDTPFLDPDHKLFTHGRSYIGPVQKPKTTWKSTDNPRGDHFAPDWLTASEYEDVEEVAQHKVRQLAAMLRLSRRTVLYTGAGISASVIGQAARSGVNKQGWHDSPMMAHPTYTHQALAALCQHGIVHEWVQQNHDGLPQKAGVPQEVMNEIHGSWFDPANPVVSYSGGLHDQLEKRMSEAADTADLVLVLGTSLGGLYADCTATKPATRTLSDTDPPLGSVMINLQQTTQDGKMSLRLFGTSDSVLKMLMVEMGLPTRFKPPVFPRERRVLVPYDKDGNPIAEGQPKMWWDLRSRQPIKITKGHNIQNARQSCFMHIGGDSDITHKGKKYKKGQGGVR